MLRQPAPCLSMLLMSILAQGALQVLPASALNPPLCHALKMHTVSVACGDGHGTLGSTRPRAHCFQADAAYIVLFNLSSGWSCRWRVFF